jgi:hypothetical protein
MPRLLVANFTSNLEIVTTEIIPVFIEDATNRPNASSFSYYPPEIAPLSTGLKNTHFS